MSNVESRHCDSVHSSWIVVHVSVSHHRTLSTESMGFISCSVNVKLKNAIPSVNALTCRSRDDERAGWARGAGGKVRRAGIRVGSCRKREGGGRGVDEDGRGEWSTRDCSGSHHKTVWRTSLLA